MLTSTKKSYRQEVLYLYSAMDIKMHSTSTHSNERDYISARPT